ncbi:MAG: type II toxin-antitoxin system VapC family toxin, partial [Thermodesulfobacteriota bacterium]|nr:type II toxin-antitoxin system VapC family toxin [Thermodesulfobacteriota bacterium]
NERDGIIFCEISLWEIAMLIKKARISIDTSYQDFIKIVFLSNKYQFKGITPEIAELSTSLPEEVNQDPADRIIAATSLIYKIPLVTTDKNLLNADSVKTIW